MVGFQAFSFFSNKKYQKVLAFIIILGLSYSSFLFLCPTKIIVYCDAGLAPELKRNIENHINNYNLISLTSLGLANHIVKITKAVQDLSISWQASRIAHVTLKAQKPHVVLNNKYIITKIGDVLDKTCFVDKALEGIPHIWSLNKKIDESLIFNCIKNINTVLFDEYDFIWLNTHEIVLKPKNNHDFIIIADYKNVGDFERLGSAQNLYKKEAYKKIDIRFDHQIVCSHLRGVNYEKICKGEYCNIN